MKDERIEAATDALVKHFSEEVRREFPSATTVPSDNHHRLRAAPIVRVVLAAADAVRGSDDGWQPIETAPRDGTMVILADLTEVAPNGSTISYEDRWVVAGSYQRNNWYNQFIEEDGEEIYPSHWMPLPTAPKRNEGE